MEAIAVGDSGDGEGEGEEEEEEEVGTTEAAKQEAQVSCYGNICASLLTLKLVSTDLPTLVL